MGDSDVFQVMKPLDLYSSFIDKNPWINAY